MPVQSASAQPELETGEFIAAIRRVAGPGALALHEPDISEYEEASVRECVASTWVSTVGRHVDQFEDMVAQYTGSSYAVATVNGTAALHVCLLLAGVRAGDEVLVPALTFVATANAVAYCQAVPHFCDAETTTLGIDPTALDAYLTDTARIEDGACRNRITGRPIRALVVMHTFGHPSRIEALAELCRRWHMTLVEDAAESLGSWVGPTHTGRTGLLGVLSFNGNKIVTTGGGGAILTADIELARRAKHLTTTARQAHRWEFMHDEVGYNYRLPNINAALGCAQMERVSTLVAEKRRLAKAYIEAMSALPGLVPVREPQGCASNYWLNAILLAPAQVHRRDELLTAAHAAGIALRPAWTLVHRFPMYADCPRMPLPVAERLEAGLINLPSSARLGRALP